MRDFEKINTEEVLSEMVNGADIFAFVLKIDSRNAVTYSGYRLRDEKIGAIQRLTNQANVVFYKRNTEAGV